MIVAKYLKSLRINSLAEPICTLESISNELALHPITSEDQLEGLVRKALMAVGAVFDAISTEQGAQIIVSGIVAGLIGAIGGSSTMIFTLTLAAWMGKDVFLKALRTYFSKL